MSLTSFIGACNNHVQLHFSKTHDPLYLHIVHTVKVSPADSAVATLTMLVLSHCGLQPLPATPSEGGVVEKPTRLAIGVEGGFDGGVEKCEILETLSVVTMPELTSVPWPCEEMPSQVSVFF